MKIFSVWMDGINPMVRAAQAAVLDKLARPQDVYNQTWTCKSHGETLDHLIDTVGLNETALFLDIDCIPLQRAALGKADAVAQGGALYGLYGRCSDRGDPTSSYVFPAALALTGATYRNMGRPTFQSGPSWDVAGCVTHEAQKHSVPIIFEYPVRCLRPAPWSYMPEVGYGTTYGRPDPMFYHQFEIRNGHGDAEFITKCHETRKSLKETG